MRVIRLTALGVALALLIGGCRGDGGVEAKGEPKSGPSRAASLQPVWEWTTPPPSYAGMPAADGQNVALVYGLHWLVLLDAQGRERWTIAHDELRDVAPLLTPALVVAASETGLAGFDRATGALRWTADLGERANTPVLAGGLAVTSTWDGSVAAVDIANGSVAWRSPIPGDALGPAATDGTVVVVSWEGDHGSGAGAVAFDAGSGKSRWEVKLEPGGLSAPAVSPAAGVAVVVAADLAAHGLSLDTGAERWRTELEGAGSPEVPPLPLPNGDIVVAHRLAGLALVDGRDGTVRWTASSEGAAVRGGPAGPGPDGGFALPLDDGRLLLAGPERPDRAGDQGPERPDRAGDTGPERPREQVIDPPGRVSGVAAGPGGTLLVATREAQPDNGITASTGW